MNSLKVICSFALTISALALSAQSGSSVHDKNWKQGFVITMSNDTIKGVMQIAPEKSSLYDLQHLLAFDNGKGTISYKPDSLRSFTYFMKSSGRGQQVSYDRTRNPERDGLIFAKRYVRGACNVFGYTSDAMHIVPGDVAVYVQHETKYLQIGDLAVAVHEEDFEEYLKQLFAHCPLILSKLASKEYEPRNWMKMVKDYNAGKCK
jgi:hypothetical protein